MFYRKTENPKKLLGIPSDYGHMVLIDAVAGCEAYNLSWFLQTGAAVSEKETFGIAEVSTALLANRAWLDDMKNAYLSFPQENAAQMIFDRMTNPVSE